jgi:hypothetical protein
LQVSTKYQLIPKEYLPFAHFSDGGMLIYTGRFFACPEICDADNSNWRIHLKIPVGFFAVAAGREGRTSLEWTDSERGQYIYVGRSRPIVTDNLISLVDPALPLEMRSLLQTLFPSIMEYLSNHLGSLLNRPTLFVSYEAAPGRGLSSKGGTLPDQIVLSYRGVFPLETSDQIQSTSWFFAHELSHLFEQDGIAEANEAWIHEGSAEAFAAQIVARGSADGAAYAAKKITEAGNSCMKGLSIFTLKNAAKVGQHRLYYDCGLVLFRRFDQDIHARGNSEGIAALWQDYRARVLSGSPPSKEIFYISLNQLAGPATVKWAKMITDGKSTDSIKALSAIK